MREKKTLKLPTSCEKRKKLMRGEDKNSLEGTRDVEKKRKENKTKGVSWLS